MHHGKKISVTNGNAKWCAFMAITINLESNYGLASRAKKGALDYVCGGQVTFDALTDGIVLKDIAVGERWGLARWSTSAQQIISNSHSYSFMLEQISNQP